VDLRSRSFDATEVEGTSVLQMDRKRDGINEEKKESTQEMRVPTRGDSEVEGQNPSNLQHDGRAESNSATAERTISDE
jgi:hypothetical protein